LGSWSFSSRRSALRPDVPGKEEILALIIRLPFVKSARR
jgi:hypothetical protein